MSHDLVSACLWLDLPPARKLVLLALCERANLSDGKCWPGRKEVAKRASLTVRSVTPHLQELERSGWLTSGKKPGAAGITTTRWVNVSRILHEGERSREDFRAEADKAREEASPGYALEDDVPEEPDEETRGSSPHEPGEAGATVTVMNRHEPSAARARELSYPRSDDSDKDRPPDAKVERWLVGEMSKHFGAKVVQRQLERCDLFFVWRKVKQYVDDGDRGTLKELLPRAQAEYQAEVREIVRYQDAACDAADTPEERNRADQIAEMYRHIAVSGKAEYDAEYAAWEQETYPAVTGAQ